MERYKPYLDWISGEHYKMRELLISLVNINSWSHNPAGLEKVIYLLSREATKLGALPNQVILDLPPHKRIDAKGNLEETPLGPALHATKRPGAPIKIFLCIHADTVYPPDSPFQKAEVLDENTMRGPGVADAKGGVVVMLKALEALERSPWANNIGWEMLINPDEEISGVGSSKLFQGAAKRNHIGLLFEPVLQNGAMVSHRKGSGNYVVKFSGKSAHASRPGLGANAIMGAAYLTVKIYDLIGRLPELTTNPAKIEGGGPNNVVPDFAQLRYNIRMQDNRDLQFVDQYVRNALEYIKLRYQVESEIVSEHVSNPKKLDEKTAGLISQFTECGKKIGLNLKWEQSGGLSDGNRLSAYGLPCIDSLGVRGENIHSPEESISLNSLVERAKLTALFLMKAASGEIVWPT
ncbi:MAG: hydrolase [Candidatus Liptonbacteria bacterium]|nr:hydrolase [Candidatus Liptonbacteria bacterium]